MTFKHCISFATNLASNFDCNWFRIKPDIVSKLLCAAIWSCCAAQFKSEFKSEQTPFPQTGHWFRSALLLCTGFGLHRIWFWTWGCVPMSYFLLRDQWLIERLSKALVGKNFSPIPSKFSFQLKKENWLVAAQNLHSIKTLLTLQLSQYCKSGSMSQHKLCGIWILFKSVNDAKFVPSEVTFLRRMPSSASTADGLSAQQTWNGPVVPESFSTPCILKLYHLTYFNLT